MTRWITVFTLIVGTCALAFAGRVRTTSQSVPLEDATSVQVRVEFGAGRSALHGQWGPSVDPVRA